MQEEGAPSSVSPSPPASPAFSFYFLFNLSFKKQSEKSNSAVKLQLKSNLKVKRLTDCFSVVALMINNPPAIRETWVRSLGWKIRWRRAWQPTPVFLPGESHGQRSLAGYSPGGRRELNTSEATLHTAHS